MGEEPDKLCRTHPKRKKHKEAQSMMRFPTHVTRGSKLERVQEPIAGSNWGRRRTRCTSTHSNGAVVVPATAMPQGTLVLHS